MNIRSIEKNLDEVMANYMRSIELQPSLKDKNPSLFHGRSVKFRALDTIKLLPDFTYNRQGEFKNFEARCVSLYSIPSTKRLVVTTYADHSMTIPGLSCRTIYNDDPEHSLEYHKIDNPYESHSHREVCRSSLNDSLVLILDNVGFSETDTTQFIESLKLLSLDPQKSIIQFVDGSFATNNFWRKS